MSSFTIFLLCLLSFLAGGVMGGLGVVKFLSKIISYKKETPAYPNPLEIFAELEKKRLEFFTNTKKKVSEISFFKPFLSTKDYLFFDLERVSEYLGRKIEIGSGEDENTLGEVIQMLVRAGEEGGVLKQEEKEKALLVYEELNS